MASRERKIWKRGNEQKAAAETESPVMVEIKQDVSLLVKQYLEQHAPAEMLQEWKEEHDAPKEDASHPQPAKKKKKQRHAGQGLGAESGAPLRGHALKQRSKAERTMMRGIPEASSQKRGRPSWKGGKHGGRHHDDDSEDSSSIDPADGKSAHL